MLQRAIAPLIIGRRHLRLPHRAMSVAAGIVHSREPSPMSSPPPHAKKPRLGSASPPPEDEVPVALQESAEKPTRGQKPKKFKKPPPPEPGSADDVSWRDVVQLLGQDAVDAATVNKTDYTAPVQFGDELELVIDMLSSNGERATCDDNARALICNARRRSNRASACAASAVGR